jgi:hypothetical protein
MWYRTAIDFGKLFGFVETGKLEDQFQISNENKKRTLQSSFYFKCIILSNEKISNCHSNS